MEKFCIDCIFCDKTSKNPTLWKCTHGAEISLVSGLPKTRYCEIERRAESKISPSGYYLCGPEGKFFEPGERF